MSKSLFEDPPHIFAIVTADEGLGVFLARVVTEVVFVCRARAIGYRQHNREAVGGFFSQIGNLYMVHHLWGNNNTSVMQNYTPSPCA